ncbi:NAD(+)/NADH kinase [Spirochaeta isovalerica]|uniref:NAD kinase n=1 Tax=Spirochaeta isovalerica TaxID=150 RepID=A0A841RHH9_9SPIO|nr:NAD(+)/NADH kinase [Spirochaeta isovalerica]MBB6481988.1 NAD+ kinase [Spirochaeta isovalerica]
MHRIKNVLIIVNRKKKDSLSIAGEIKTYLEEKNIQTTLHETETPIGDIGDLEIIDLAISLGGDGTVLYASRILADFSIPVMPINLGTFGFITEVSFSEWKNAFEEYSSGLLGVSKRVMIDVSVFRDGNLLRHFKGLNDVVVNADGIAKLLNLNVDINHENLGIYRADGVIIATPTGSTAYSIAAGGPIMHPDMTSMILTPICPFSLSNRPIVVPSSDTIKIRVEEDQRAKVILTVDGQLTFPLEEKDEVHITEFKRRIPIVRSDKRSFFGVVKSKLRWSGGNNA